MKVYIDANTIIIRSAALPAALHTTGAAGPSVIDAHGWRRICMSFKRASSELCHQLAMVAWTLNYLLPFLACRLIALNKNLGIRPIRIGDTCSTKNYCQICPNHSQTRYPRSLRLPAIVWRTNIWRCACMHAYNYIGLHGFESDGSEALLLVII